MTVLLIIAGLIISLFLFRRGCNVVTTTIKMVITLVLFSPILNAVAGVKHVIGSLAHSALAWAIIPLSIYILLYIISPHADD